MPVVRGDFFNYADTRNDYWTGYYSTRTFFKKFSRGVGSMSKSINALFALLTAFGREPSDKADLPIILQRARRSVAVYQNHHGITGVSSKAAVREYVKGMHEARWRLKNTFLLLVQHALSREGFPTTPVGEDFEVSEKKKRFNEIVAPGIVSVPSAESEEVKSLVFYNNLPHTRIEYVTIRTNTDAVEVRNADGEVVLAQVCPAYDVIQDKLAFVAGIYSVTFPVRVPALGLTTMFIGYGAPTNTNAVQRCEIITSNSILGSSTPQGAKSLRTAGPSDPMCMENGVLTVCADKKTGRLRTADKATFEEDYVRYSTWTAKDGQVLMSVTDLGKAVPEGEQNVAHALFRGIYTDEHAYQVGARLRVARLAKEGVRGIDALGLRYLDVSIKDQFREDALSLRIKTNVRGRKDYKLKFVTDINGFAYAERVFRKDMPPSANFFPITTSLRVQDQEQRVAFLVAQPMGATCYKTSDDVAVATCEFIVDRKTHSDDGKGLADKVEDGVPTLAEFRISFEEPDSAEVLDSPTASELSHALGTRLNNHIEYGVGASRKASAWKKGFGVEVAPLASDLPLDVEIPNLQVATSVLGAGEIGITLARHIVGRHVAQRSQKDEVCISLTDLFKCAQVVDVTEHTLTYLHEFDETENTAVMDGTVCLQKGTIHSYTFNVRIDQDCRVPSMASPRPSKWSLPGDNEDDAANANKKAYDGMFDDAEFDGTPPGIPTQQAKKIGNRKNKQKHQIGQNPIEENDNDNDEDDNNEENVKNKKTNVQLGDDIFEEDEWDTGENNNNDNDNDNKDHFEDDNENTDEEKTGHNKAYNNINTIKHNNNDNDDDGEIGINTKTKHTENKRNIYKEQNNEEEEENNMNIDDDQQQQRQQQQKLNHNTNNDEDDNNDDEKEGNDYLTNNDNNKKDNDQPNNMYPTVVEVDQQTEINKKQNAEAATTSYDTKSSTKIQVGIVTVSMSFIISFFLFVKRIISAKIFGIILITTALINTIIFIF